MPGSPDGTERRRHSRLPIRVPVRVRGRDVGGTAWEEVTSCLDVGVGGAGLVMTHPVSQGQVLHLSVPLPARFRQYDIVEASYRVYALVRSARPAQGSGARVGVLFLGRHPPRGSEPLPADLYLMPGERPVRPARPHPRLRLRLGAEQAPGGIEQEEEAVAEHVAPRVVVVRAARLPASRGVVLGVEEVGGDYRGRAEVSSISIGTDGQPRLSLRMLDEPLPDRLLSREAES